MGNRLLWSAPEITAEFAQIRSLIETLRLALGKEWRDQEDELKGIKEQMEVLSFRVEELEQELANR